MRIVAACLSMSMLTLPAQGDIYVRFYEGAPKDRFEFALEDQCATGPVTLRLDLAGSPAGLVFDVTAAGAGVAVFQPVELVAGAARVSGISAVQDGDTGISLELTEMVPGDVIAFTVDIDDTLGARSITVSGAEISGASAHATVAGQTHSAVFGADATAVIRYNGCLS
ncbi:MAG: aggregation factor core [Pseudomonadota bacterium]